MRKGNTIKPDTEMPEANTSSMVVVQDTTLPSLSKMEKWEVWDSSLGEGGGASVAL